MKVYDDDELEKKEKKDKGKKGLEKQRDKNQHRFKKNQVRVQRRGRRPENNVKNGISSGNRTETNH